MTSLLVQACEVRASFHITWSGFVRPPCWVPFTFGAVMPKSGITQRYGREDGMRRTSITEQSDDQRQPNKRGRKKRQVFGKVFVALAVCAVLATMTPDTASANSEIFKIERNSTYDTCRVVTKLAQTTNYSYGAAYRRGDACQYQALKVKLGYTAASGKRYYTPYTYDMKWAQVTRYNTTPRYSTACIHGPNTGRWGCFTVWA